MIKKKEKVTEQGNKKKKKSLIRVMEKNKEGINALVSLTGKELNGKKKSKLGRNIIMSFLEGIRMNEKIL